MPLDHLVDETLRSIELDDLGREALPNPEVHGLERDSFAEFKEARCPSADSPFTSRRGCFDVSVDIPCEVEADFDGSQDPRLYDDRGHFHSFTAPFALSPANRQ